MPIERLTQPQYRTGEGDRFNVVQFFDNDAGHEYVRRNVTAEEAVEAFNSYTKSLGAQIGTTVRVIITDMGDMINAEWKRGEGLVYPPKGVGK